VSNRPQPRAPLFLFVLLLALAAPVATASGDPLAPELAQLSEPALSTASAEAQARAIGFPEEGPGSLIREGDRVVVEARFESGAEAAVEALEAAGAEVLLASGRYQTVAAAIAPEDLDALAAVPGLASVLPARAPIVYAADEASTAAAAAGAQCEGGSVISEALGQLNVSGARAAFGARGAGQTIGVLSDSFDTATQAVFGGPIATHAAGDEATGDLPGPVGTCGQVPVNVLAPGPSNATDEGRAMLQAVHDLAPHAQLAFATAYSSEVEFAHNIERLAEPVAAGGAGADVIVDDIGYQAEPFFQDGIVAAAIRHVTEAGVTYLTAAGNQNVFDSAGREIGSWEAPEFRAVGCPAAITALGTKAPPKCMDFNPGSGEDSTFGITVPAGETLSLDLQWAEPWYGVETDLNAYLLNKSGTEILPNSPYVNYKSGSGAVPVPVEFPEWTNVSGTAREVQLVVGRCSGTCDPKASATLKPRLKVLFGADGSGFSSIEYPRSEGGDVVGPTIFGHSGAASAISVGAVYFERSATAPTEPERYSARGPATHYFGPVTGTVPAAKLATPEVVQKPNIIATDCASNTFFGNYFAGGWHFCGTSQAAPHAAAAAALMKQTAPLASPAGIVGAMEASGTPFTVVNTRAAVGGGLLNARAAIEALGGTPVEDPATTSVSAPPTTTQAPPPAAEEPQPTPAAGPIVAPPTAEPVKAPMVRIASHPRKVVKTRKRSVRLVFRFAGDPGSTFLCEFAPGPRRPCRAKVTRSFAVGLHRVSVRAVGPSGVVGKPVVFRFRVQRADAAGR
jgi:hypothetical protein